MALRINEAIKEAKKNGKFTKLNQTILGDLVIKSRIGNKDFENEMNRKRDSITRLANGKTGANYELLVRNIMKVTGVDANFLFGITKEK